MRLHWDDLAGTDGSLLRRWHFSGGILNPASMKQALVEGAEPIPGISMYEQGQGKLNLVRSKVCTPTCQSSCESSLQKAAHVTLKLCDSKDANAGSSC